MPERTNGLASTFDYRSTSYGPFDLEAITGAADLVRRAWPEEYGDWTTTLRVVVPRLEPPHISLSGFSALSYQGAVWVGPRAMLQMVDVLVHEQSHVKLRYIEDTQPILDPEQSGQVFSVGWRPDPRPVVGIFEGVYVNMHVCEALERVAARGLVGPAERDQLRLQTRRHAANVREALAILAEHARFTPAGSGFLDWADSWSRRFAAAPEPA